MYARYSGWGRCTTRAAVYEPTWVSAEDAVRYAEGELACDSVPLSWGCGVPPNFVELGVGLHLKGRSASKGMTTKAAAVVTAILIPVDSVTNT